MCIVPDVPDFAITVSVESGTAIVRIRSRADPIAAVIMVAAFIIFVVFSIAMWYVGLLNNAVNDAFG